MSSSITDLDGLLLDRWHDATGIRDALKELEERLQTRIEKVAERLEPWLEERGYELFDVGKSADISVVKPHWSTKKKEALVWISIGGLYPYGFRKLDEEHPFVWVYSYGLQKNERETFRAELVNKLKNHTERWINDDCGREAPAGMYITSHGDNERISLARSEEALEEFIKAHLPAVLALGDDIDAALAIARPEATPRTQG